MARILLLFASAHGQTEKVAVRLASKWRSLGHEVDVRSIKEGQPPPPAGFDLVVLGSRLMMTYDQSIRRYVEAHRGALAAVRSGFFSVSMSASSAEPEGRAAADTAIRRLLDETKWWPAHVASFGGALPYTKYDPVTRFVVKAISARVGHTTDTSRDHEFTDWVKVDEFADTVAKTMAGAPVATTPATSGVTAVGVTS
jgi:menaquinone-dependent protoporphyrinogen oxidase